MNTLLRVSRRVQNKTLPSAFPPAPSMAVPGLAVPGLAAACEAAVATFVQYDGLLAHQHESYDYFVRHQLREIVIENSEVVLQSEKHHVHHRLVFQQVYLRPPSLQEVDGFHHSITPHESRIRGLSYNIGVFVDVAHHVTEEGQEAQVTIYRELLLCQLPCMVRSAFCALRVLPQHLHHQDGECPMDKGGYFIISGTEKCTVAQERLRSNYPFVRVLGPAWCVAEVRSSHVSKTRSTSTVQIHLVLRGKVLQLLVHLPFIEVPVPLLLLLRLLGISVEEAEAFILGTAPRLAPDAEHVLAGLLRQALVVPKAELLEVPLPDLVEWLGRAGTKEPTAHRRGRYVDHILVSELLPHLGATAEPAVQRRKAAFLSLVGVKLLRVHLGHLPPDDRDDLALKRVDTTGQLFALLFRQLFRNFLRNLQAYLHKAVEAGRPVNLADAMAGGKITSGFKYAMATGQWGVQKMSAQTGVVQVHSRQNVIGALSHLRRVNTPIAREGKLPKPRELSLSHYGRLCAVETPEGQACGLVEVLALLTHVRHGGAPELLKRQVRRLGLPAYSPDACAAHRDAWLVLVNGSPEAYTTDAEATVAALRAMRRVGSLPFDTSVALRQAEQQVLVDSDSGCLLRPLLRAECLSDFVTLVQRTPPPLLWRALMSSGVLELVDRLEEGNLRVATRAGPAWATHVEVHPTAILGLCAGVIPFLNHNQAPRNLFQAAMGKQAMGTYAQTFERRPDALAHVLHYPQAPLVSTMLYAACGGAAAPTFANTIVAIACYGGFNQEDSIIVSREALQRGLFRSTLFRTHRDEDRSYGGDLETFRHDEATAVQGLKCASYAKLDPDGLPRPRVVLEPGDVMISKRLYSTRAAGPRDSGPLRCVDHSTVHTSAEKVVVDDVIFSSTATGGPLVRLRVRSARVPEIGDKLSSRHAQKGVIGMIYPAADMPYTADGVVPDLIINPHAIPSRMTIAQLLEMVLGKAACCVGTPMDGTPFQRTDVLGETAAVLSERGFESRGNETLFCGLTGRPLDAAVFLGPCAYQRLRHVVIDKVHARSRGPNQLLTRQPCEGRSKGGGLRFGEMEKDAVCAHGASRVLLDRLMEQSDELEVAVCRTCGLLAEDHAEGEPPGRRLLCRLCRHEGSQHVAQVRIPAAARLLIHELAGLNVAVRLRLGQPGDEGAAPPPPEDEPLSAEPSEDPGESEATPSGSERSSEREEEHSSLEADDGLLDEEFTEPTDD